MALVKYNNRSILNVTALDSIASGGMNLITTNTISSGVSSSSFTSNIDSTYDTYMFKFINMHAGTDSTQFEFQGSTNGGSSYGVTITSSNFYALHAEADNETTLSYATSHDLAQSTDYQNISENNGIENDECVSGYLYLFAPSSTTFVKHWIYVSNYNSRDNYTRNRFGAGYFNTTSAINAIDFKMSSGNIDSGVIKMYGLSKS
jgi:hypothetical protein